MFEKPYNKEVSINQVAGTPEKVKVYPDGPARGGKVGIAAVLLQPGD